MNKATAIVIGVLVLVGAYFVIFKQEQKPADTASVTNDNTAQTEQTQPKPVEIVVNYQPNVNFQPQTYSVKEGDQVVMKVTSDIVDEVHFHGYDLSIDLEIHEPGEIAFTADKTGRFEFELEHSKITLGVIEVQPQ